MTLIDQILIAGKYIVEFVLITALILWESNKIRGD